MLLIRQAEAYSVIKLDPTEPIPQAPSPANLWSIALTHDELSLVCATAQAPASGIVDQSDDWTAFRVAGTMDFALTGVISRISEPIASAGLGIFVLSTFDTDYILVKTRDADTAMGVWRSSTISVIEPLAQTARLALVDLASELNDVALINRTHKVWATDYPTEEELIVAGLALAADSTYVPELPQSFQIRTRSAGEAIGGIGFKATQTLSDITATEIGFSIAESKRGNGYATEAILGIIAIARERGIRFLCAETDSGNTASQRVLTKSGFDKLPTQERLSNSQANQNNSLFLLELQ